MAKKFAQIAVNVTGVGESFDYLVTRELEKVIRPGHLVAVPFGSQLVQGIVMGIKPTPEVDHVKPIQSLIEDEPVIPRPYLALAEKLSDTYFYPASAYLTAMLPPGLAQRADTLFEACLPDEADMDTLTNMQQRILNLLNDRGVLQGRQLDRAIPRVDWRPGMRKLVESGWVSAESILPAPKVSPKRVKTVRLRPELLALDLHEVKTGRPGSAASQRRMEILKLLVRENEDVDISYIYASTGASSADIRYLEKAGLVLVNSMEVMRDPVEDMPAEGTPKPVLTDDQRETWQVITTALKAESPLPVILHGITGSGKTELYLRAAEEMQKSGKQTIMLVPEISLTPQTIQRFLDRFPGRVGVVHSKLSAGERYDTWRRAQQGAFSVLIGPRSALMTPMPDPGLIILDECHDDSYYQQEMGPAYSSIEAALMLSRITGSGVIFGSATPGVNLVYRARRNRWPIARLTQRIDADSGKREGNKPAVHIPLPEVAVVDMRTELKEGNRSIFSTSLQEELRNVIAKNEQAILFLNRRGSSSVIFCRDCGYTAQCPQCDFPLTYHSDRGILLCHTCGYERGDLRKCPECGGHRIRQYGMGTKRVEEELQELIPESRVLRWDADTYLGKRTEAVVLSHFKNHNADILIGTQMLAKGLDLPLVTLVGMILADVGLNFPDYRASERAFQLLTQVAGRAGRSVRGGKAILQTFQPENYAIQHASLHDYEGFFKAEIDRRRKIQYPPFSRLIRLEARDVINTKAQERIRKAADEIVNLMETSSDKTLRLVGPAPPFFSKRRGYYRWQVILKGARPEEIIRQVNLRDLRVEVDPPDLL